MRLIRVKIERRGRFWVVFWMKAPVWVHEDWSYWHEVLCRTRTTTKWVIRQLRSARGWTPKSFEHPDVLATFY